jgi:hypothetical protein
MIAFACMIVSMTIPRIIPLSMHEANTHVRLWMVDSIRNGDLKRFQHLDTFSKQFSSSINTASVAVEQDNECTAIALIEKHNNSDHLYLCALESNDGSSATLLFKSLIATCPTIQLRSDIDERWKIAHVYYSVARIRPSN